MAVLEELKKEGWCISEDGLKLIDDEGRITNPQILAKKALDADLREIAAPGFPEEVGRCKVEGIPGGLVVQLQKVRNVSAPKSNEESGVAPRMLKLTVTDGHCICHAIEIERIPQLTVNTPPGTKILLKPQPEGVNIPVANNYLLLTPQRAEVLGGRVIHMIERWELNRSLAKHTRSIGEDGGPPPWIPFGQKIVRSNPNDKNFKSLQDKDKQNPDNVNPEFEAQRKDAIAEAGRAGAKKVFGGGNRQLLDHNVQQVIEAGYTIEQAEAALKSANNNVERAIRFLQRSNENGKGSDGKRSDKEGGRETGRGGKKDGGRGRSHGGDDENVGPGPKPSGRLSLFDFLEDKLPFDDKDKDKFQGGSARGGSDRGGRGGGSQRGGRSGPGRDPRGQPAERGGRGGGRGRGGDRRPAVAGVGAASAPGLGLDRPPRDDARNKDRREQVEKKGKKEDNTSGRGAIKAAGEKKAPRFLNQRAQLQHESSRYVGHTPPGVVSTNSSLGQGSSDWGSTLAGRVGMMSLLDCESTPENDILFGNSTWSNSALGGEDLQSFGQQQQARPRDGGRNAVQTGKGGPRPLQQQNRQPPDFNNSSFENGILEGYGTGGPQGAAGRARNAYSNNFMPSIPAFPFNDNGNAAIPHLANHGNSRGHGAGIKSGESNASWPWQCGDKCMAKYWEDERYYNAEVTGVSDKTCVVRFVEYGNHEEVLKDDCIPITEDAVAMVLQNSLTNGNSVTSMNSPHPLNPLNPMNRPHPNNPVFGNPSKPMRPMNAMNAQVPPSDANAMPFSGIMEFRRGGTRPYMKQTGPENNTSSGPRERRPQRAQQSMYVPPAQRK